MLLLIQNVVHKRYRTIRFLNIFITASFRSFLFIVSQNGVRVKKEMQRKEKYDICHMETGRISLEKSVK